MAPAKSRRAFIRQICAAGAWSYAGDLCAADRPASQRLTIANAAGSLNLTMGALMRQERFLESFDLSPEFLVVADGTKILGGIVGGSIDATFMSGFGQVFPAIARGAPLKVLGGGALLPGLALFSAKPDIQNLKALEGRTIGTGAVGALTYQLTVSLLRKYAVDSSNIRFANVGSSTDIFRAVSAGTVDAGVGDVALTGEARKYGVHLIPHGNLAEELKQYTYQGAWASDHLIASRRDTLVKALAAYAQLYRFVQRPDSRDAFLRARRSVFPGTGESSHEAEWSYIQGLKPFAVDLILTPERVQYMQKLNVEFKVQTSILPFSQVADMSLAADAVKLLSRRSI